MVKLAGMASRIAKLTGTVPPGAMRSYHTPDEGARLGTFTATNYKFSCDGDSITIEPDNTKPRSLFTSDYWQLFVPEMRNFLYDHFHGGDDGRMGSRYVVVRGKPSKRRFWRINLYNKEEQDVI